MSQVHIGTGFSDANFYDHFESTAITLESPLVGSEIAFKTMIFCWDHQGELIRTGIIESRLLDTYREVGHLEWDPKEPNVFQCMDTDNDEGGDDDTTANQSSRIDRFMFIARGVDIPPADPMVVAPNTVVNNCTEIPKDPAAVTIALGTDIAGEVSLETSVAGVLRVPDITLHRQTVGSQVPPDLQRQLTVGKPPLPVVQASRNKLSHNNDHRAASSRPQPSLGNDVFRTSDANIQGAHLILRSLPELDPMNPLTLTVN